MSVPDSGIYSRALGRTLTASHPGRALDPDGPKDAEGYRHCRYCGEYVGMVHKPGCLFLPESVRHMDPVPPVCPHQVSDSGICHGHCKLWSSLDA
jgi:hypothetical protein